MEKDKLMQLLRKSEPFLKRYRPMILVLFAGILILSLSAVPKTQAKQPAQSTGDAQATADTGAFDLNAFEQKLTQQLSKIKGAGRVCLTLTLKSTQEEVYAADVRQSKQGDTVTSYESTLAAMDSGGSGQQPIPVKRLYPTFQGALVLCDGAQDPNVQLAVTQAVSTVCGLGADKIAVLQMQ